MGSRETSHGMTWRETEIVERFERGESFDQIARAMGITIKTAKKIAKYYTTGLAPDHRVCANLKRGSALLLAAIQQARAA